MKNALKIASNILSGGAATPPIFYDTFTDANGTAFSSHTPDVGGAWTVEGSICQIQSNKLQVMSAAVEVAKYDSGLSIGLYFAFKCTVGASGGSAGVILRQQDAANYWMAYFQNNIVILRRVIGGSGGNRFTQAVAFDGTVEHDCRISVYAGGSYGYISWAWDGGEPVVSTGGLSGDFLTATGCGLYIGSLNTTMDDYQLRSAPINF